MNFLDKILKTSEKTPAEKVHIVLQAIKRNDRKAVVKLLETKGPLNNPIALPYNSEAINKDLDRMYEYINIFNPTDNELAAAIAAFLFHKSEKSTINILKNLSFPMTDKNIHNISIIMFSLRSISDFKTSNIKKYSIATCGDSRVCDKCNALQGKTFLTSNAEIGKTAPPFCDYCRCRMKPIFK